MTFRCMLLADEVIITAYLLPRYFVQLLMRYDAADDADADCRKPGIISLCHTYR